MPSPVFLRDCIHGIKTDIVFMKKQLKPTLKPENQMTLLGHFLLNHQ